MKKIIISLIVASTFLCAGCLSLTKLPSVCDDITSPSILCQVFNDNGVRIEDVGNSLIIVNAVAISEGVYTKEEAIKVLNDLLLILDSPVSYISFSLELEKVLKDYPGLFMIAKDYIEMILEQTEIRGRFIYAADKNMLKSWISQVIQILKNSQK